MPTRGSSSARCLIHLLCLLILVATQLARGAVLRTLAANRWSVHATRQALLSGQSHNYTLLAPVYHPRAALWLARLALARGDPASAITTMRGRASLDPLAEYMLAEAYERAGDLPSAVDHWLSLRAWPAMRQAGLRALKERRLDDALVAIQTAYTIEPSELASDYASVLCARGNVDRAEDVLRDVIRRFGDHPSNPSWRVMLGHMLAKQGRWQDSLEVFEYAVATSPHSADAHIGHGRAIYFCGLGLEQAMDEIAVGIQLAPHSASGYIAMADILRGEKDYKNADYWYARAAQEEPQSSLAIQYRLDALLEAGDVEFALTVANAAVARFPHVAHLHYQLRSIYARLGDMEQAVSCAEMSVALDRTANPLYTLSLGRAYEQAGMLDRAIDIYRAAASQYPGNHGAIEALTRLGVTP